MPSSPDSRSEVLVEKQGPALAVTFNRPRQRNAMTWAMYDGLYQACERADADDDVRVLVLRGAGEDAFVAGTDIRQFADFTGGADGVEYERKITRVLDRLEDVNVPTVAAIRGYCVGAGLAIAAVCDLRLATPDARFGIPIARTLGNCLSMPTYALLLHHLGPARTLDLLLNAKFYSGREAHAAGFVAESTEDLDKAVQQTVDRLAGHAPLTMWATKEAIRRLRRGRTDGDDIVSRVYGSDDFRTAVRAFTAKQPTTWTGR
ncbi:enoyl-CoA hydratase/isomerase family protein [Micromonospora sp. 4G57]|uniref:Enoyl-CoA hydratase/isomerase family protein n=1 Tax=Micromonospora sicca TaxID=2202420 RepID=A0ABU5J6A7_9ACTN|nr:MULTISPECIES: enoyl-CoA hydratase/isomerase family protein [unclassified Micromonospora]MDZ5443456.1 enoyl-CoA hydratase/isomerase family protein [Micromonospora sp. 4G57]MDZ5488044.1 enoyl-CoA hydratase/isomerase family protein [Micromonospora sp. 4G53]